MAEIEVIDALRIDVWKKALSALVMGQEQHRDLGRELSCLTSVGAWIESHRTLEERMTRIPREFGLAAQAEYEFSKLPSHASRVSWGFKGKPLCNLTNRSRISFGSLLSIFATDSSVSRNWFYKSSVIAEKRWLAHGHGCCFKKLGNLASRSSFIGSKREKLLSKNSNSAVILCWPSMISKSSLCILATTFLYGGGK
jgi:hypothetical protein